MGISDYYIMTITPRSKSSSSDSMGGYDDTWSNGTAFKGRIRRLRSDEQVKNEQKKSITTHRLYCDASNTLTTVMRVVEGSDTYEVIAVYEVNDMETGHHLEVDLKKVD